MTANRGNYHTSGFSLVELTVATALFSLGMGSLSLLYLLSIQGTLEARLQTLAVSHAESAAEMVLLAPDALDRFIHPEEDSEIECVQPNRCNPEQITDSFMESWQNQLEKVFPNGGGLFCRDSTPFDGTTRDFACDGRGDVVIKIAWEEPSTGDAGPVPHRVVNQLALP